MAQYTLSKQIIDSMMDGVEKGYQNILEIQKKNPRAKKLIKEYFKEKNCDYVKAYKDVKAHFAKLKKPKGG
ncbi:hypothetical protein JXA85_00145 [Candidatus Woesearchaeota archaeon]|nr:hypothetical protein [Candidatus Woesearchaeota archaeon]